MFVAKTVGSEVNYLVFVFDEVDPDVLLPCGGQGAVREALHPNALKVAVNAHVRRVNDRDCTKKHTSHGRRTWGALSEQTR